jgi:hypothetical protein
MKIVVPKERKATIPTIMRLIIQIAIFSRKACCTCLSVIPPTLAKIKGGRKKVRVRDIIAFRTGFSSRNLSHYTLFTQEGIMPIQRCFSTENRIVPLENRIVASERWI